MKIAVLMSTYNGEKYLREQMDSILAQKGVDVQIYVRDDGSSDSTPDMLREYQAKYPDTIYFINSNKITNCGVKKSFLSLLKYVAEKREDINYFCFADQDDFWLEDKLNAAITLLEAEHDNPKGKLYYSNKTFVDQDLKLIREENITFYDDFFEALFPRSLCYGCTMVFDRALALLAQQHYPQSKCIHDSWVYRLARAVGSSVVFDDKSYILYRQHGNNEVGMAEAKLHHTSVLYMIRKFLPMLFKKRTHHMTCVMKDVSLNYDSVLGDEQSRIIKVFLKYRFSIPAKYKLIFNKDMRKRTFKTRLVWAYSVIFNRL